MDIEFYERMQYSTRKLQPKKSVYKSEGVHYGLCRAYNTINFNVQNGLRVTTDCPDSWNRTCLVFGTSQVFGEEVPDDLTCTSVLQRIFNEKFSGIRVINHSLPASTAIERSNFLISKTPLKSGDIVVFIFGSNDCGFRVDNHHHMFKMTPVLLLLNFLRQKKLFSLVFLDAIREKLIERHILSTAEYAFDRTITALENISQFASMEGLHLLLVLQPTLYTSKRTSGYDNELVSRFETILEGQLRSAYPKYADWIKSDLNSISMVSIFDAIYEPIYLDWVHINARGHELLAQNLFEAIQFRFDL